MSLMRATKLLMQGARPLRPQDVFATSLYTGNGGTQTITTGVDSTDGLLWIKPRSTDGDHILFCSSPPSNGRVRSNSTAGEGFFGAATTRSKTGFTFNNYGNEINGAGVDYAAWSFRQADKFHRRVFVEHTTGTASTISLPSFGPIGMVIGKNRSASGNWPVWHRSLPAGQGFRLNLSNPSGTLEAWIDVSGQTITLSASAPSGNYVLYVFAHNPDLIDCGSYVGNGASNVNGPVVACGNGWVPQFLLIKTTIVPGEWYILDTSRGITTGNDPSLSANSSNAEDPNRNLVNLLANGFRPNDVANSNGRPYAYLAIRSPT